MHREQIAKTASTPEYHAVRFYENERALAKIVAKFLSDGFASGSPGVVVATPGLRGALLRELTARSLDVLELQRSNDLVLLDAEDTLTMFMVDGQPDAAKFRDSICEVITGACRGREDCTIRIFGQMVDVLWSNGKQDAAIRLEMLWNQLAQTEAFALLCGYAMGHFYKDASIKEVCRHHTHVLSADGEAAAVA